MVKSGGSENVVVVVGEKGHLGPKQKSVSFIV